MNINDVINEDLGNLTQLNAGPLINVLKQSGYYASRNRGRYSSSASEIRNRFQQHGIGSTSEIVDIGVLKQGMKNLRKGFKDHETARGFVAYIGNKAVMFGITDAHDLAGSSRESLIAYDLTKWAEVIDQMYAGKYTKPRTSTFKQEEPSRWGDTPDRPRNYAGTVMDTGYLSSLFTLMQEISKQTNEPLTAKLILNDTAAIQKQRQRLSAREINAGTKDLRTRLAMYKNSKKPTVGSVKEFIAMSLRNPGARVQFAGTTYNLKSSSYDKVDPTNLLKGLPFSVSYSSADPGIYDSLNIVYKFDTATNQLLPIKATFTDRRGGKYANQEEILDPRLYIIDATKSRDFDKDSMIPMLLKMLVDRKYDTVNKVMKALTMMGNDWPELVSIRKSLDAAIAAKNG